VTDVKVCNKLCNFLRIPTGMVALGLSFANGVLCTHPPARHRLEGTVTWPHCSQIASQAAATAASSHCPACNPDNVRCAQPLDAVPDTDAQYSNSAWPRPWYEKQRYCCRHHVPSDTCVLSGRLRPWVQRKRVSPPAKTDLPPAPKSWPLENPLASS
jgi:hypothetical protein